MILRQRLKEDPGIAVTRRGVIDGAEQLNYNFCMKSEKTASSKKRLTAVVLIVLQVLIVCGISIYLGGCAQRAPLETEGDNGGSEPLGEERRALGVWWWDNRLGDEYLDFAAQKGVTEIYAYYSSFSEKTVEFIRKAAERGIDVLWLQGKYEWIEDYADLQEKMEEFNAFQQSSEYKFVGVHFDIEPHQHPEFESRRNELITAFVCLTVRIKSDYPDLRVEYDIPFWLDDEVTSGGVTKNAYRFVIDNSYRVNVMSYRDDADKILECASEEADYAAKSGKPMNLCVETGENEDIVTFFEEGAEYMENELNEVRENLPNAFGIAVHHIRTWRELSQKTLPSGDK